MLTMLADAPHALEQWTPLHVHLGTQHQVAHVALLEGDTLAPAQRALVQLVFERPSCAVPGDRFVVRNAQANRTVGGGHVLDPFAPARKRRSPERLQWLDAMQTLLDTGSLDALFSRAPHGLSRALLERLTGMPAAALVLPAGYSHDRTVGHDALLVADSTWRALAERLTSASRNTTNARPMNSVRTCRASGASRRRWSTTRCGAHWSTMRRRVASSSNAGRGCICPVTP